MTYNKLEETESIYSAESTIIKQDEPKKLPVLHRIKNLKLRKDGRVNKILNKDVKVKHLVLFCIALYLVPLVYKESGLALLVRHTVMSGYWFVEHQYHNIKNWLNEDEKIKPYYGGSNSRRYTNGNQRYYGPGGIPTRYVNRHGLNYD
ncbi:unnamed protein product [Bursaphelenchus okinawaensis]|uniref:Uncharacterized protein n=1 Tax=Bursaphelenchus okinawaensis TaxID=465554 RepID=A0A811KCY7_9BILA|nr:unnamed protein product [Bursaphelenchus okinawaensis]CAG9097461.1 unnamed protein product [Bursaphelenchus okinawaensis]